MSFININIESPDLENSENLILKFDTALKNTNSKNLREFGKIVINKLKQYSERKNWKTIGGAIEQTQISENEIHISPNADKKKLVGWLHYGTQRHFIAPVRANVLHWQQNGKDYFSKGHFVRGITATNFFKVTPDMIDEIKSYLQNVKIISS